MKKLLIPLIILMMVLSGCGNGNTQSISGNDLSADESAKAQNEAGEAVPEFTAFEELSGKTISMLTGAPFEELISSKVPDVKEFTYFAATPDMTMAVTAGKTDACLTNNALATLAVHRDTGLALFPEPLKEAEFGIAFTKGYEDLPRWQAAYDTIPQETIQELWEKWTGADESKKVMMDQDWPGEGGTIRVAATDTVEPMSYAGEGGVIMGFDAEVILLMAKELDVRVEFTGMEFAAALSAVQAGKADIACGSIIITDERREAMDFVEYYPAAFVLLVRSLNAEGDGKAAGTITSVSQLNDPSVNLGVGIGSAHEERVREALPKANVIYINETEFITSLKAGKIDAFAMDLKTLEMSLEKGAKGLKLLDGTIGEDIPIAVGISKKARVPDLEDKINAFIDEVRADGTLDDMYRRWLIDGDEDIPDIPVSSSPDYHLIIGTTGLVLPYTYYKGSELNGYDIELARRFAAWLNADYEFKVYDYGAIVMAAKSGDVDCIMANLNVTDERKEAMTFSQPVLTNQVGAIVRDSGSETAVSGFFDEIQESFEKTFIRENRWKLFVSGIETTLLITVFSIIFGTILGFAVFMACRNGNPAANAITKFAVWLVQGMPMVVLLMVLYYIVFGSVEISGVVVAIIGFTLIFGAAVYGMLKVGVGAVDKGQMEGALALGYSDSRAFFRVILPQAIPHILPVYQGEIVALLKATAIVGYIAVQDLTRMGDLIRARTYDAFFPLIAVAVVYFILAAILTGILKRITINFNYKQRTKETILKGVKTDD